MPVGPSIYRINLSDELELRDGGPELTRITFDHYLNFFGKFTVEELEKANLCFLPLNLIDWKFANLDPWAKLIKMD